MGISKNQDHPSSQEKKVLLSVIIATYNGHDYIDRCLESFTRQSIESNLFEVIIVNNNSTDDTKQIVLKYVNQFDYFFLLEENNPGVSYARNKGIRHARGKYV
jgi:glycosyltransferase involved in cell wall biosynthesis